MPGLPESAQDVKDLIQENLGEEFIIIDSSGDESPSSVIQRVMGDITASSAGRQAAIGGVSGW